MARRGTHTAIAVITTISVLVSVALLTLATAGTPKAQAAGCEGGGGGSPSASESPSASPSGGGGPNPTSILTLLPGDESPSASPSGSARPSASGGGASPSNTQTSSADDEKREVVPVTVQQDQSCKSTITIKYSTRKKAFGGRVGSEEDMCKRARKVQVKRIKKGKDATVGRSVTNPRGVYKVPSRRANGRFYAVVAKATVENGSGGRTTCEAARSKTLRP